MICHASNLTILVATVTLLSSCTPNPSDEEKFAELGRRCQETALEVVQDVVVATSVALNEVQFPPPVGAANLPVLDVTYSPFYLVEKLVTPPNAFPEVQFTYEVPLSKVTDPKCAGTFALLVREPGESRKQLPCSTRVRLTDDFRGKYAIEYRYGSLDRFGIRSFDLQVVNREQNTVVAYQRTVQLLLGSMESRESTVLLGWGSAQGTRNCKLTPPDTFVKRVLRGGA